MCIVFDLACVGQTRPAELLGLQKNQIAPETSVYISHPRHTSFLARSEDDDRTRASVDNARFSQYRWPLI